MTTISLKSLETVKIISAHLAKQRKGSRVDGPDSTCAYRGTDNNMCAIGCLIPDELYNKKYEGKNIRALMSYPSDLVKHVTEQFGEGEALCVAYAAQKYHDHGSYDMDLLAHVHLSDEEFAQLAEQRILTLASENLNLAHMQVSKDV